MNFCPHCGTKLGQASHFCANCGAPLTPAQAAPQKSALASDPSLTSNIILITLAFLFLVCAVVGGRNIEKDSWEDLDIGISLLAIPLVLGIFAFLPSSNHIDTPKMDLLKTFEAFSLSLVALVCSFFLRNDVIVLAFMVFVSLLSLLVVLKIRKIPDPNRNTYEKIIYAVSIIMLAIALFAIVVHIPEIFQKTKKK